MLPRIGVLLHHSSSSSNNTYRDPVHTHHVVLDCFDDDCDPLGL